MEIEVGGMTGASHGEKSADRALTAVIREADVQAISTRSVDDMVKANGTDRISKSQAQVEGMGWATPSILKIGQACWNDGKPVPAGETHIRLPKDSAWPMALIVFST